MHPRDRRTHPRRVHGPATVLHVALALIVAATGCDETAPAPASPAQEEREGAGGRDPLDRPDGDGDGEEREGPDGTECAGREGTDCCSAQGGCGEGEGEGEGEDDNDNGEADPGACEYGFGIPEGGQECVPVDEVCVDAPACFRAASWHDGRCAFEMEADGTACEAGEGDEVDACVERLQCRAGRCAEVRPACAEVRPIVFVHGINGRADEWDPVVARLEADGWPPELLFRFEAEDPSWTCNVDNAEAIGELIEEIRGDTCHPQVDLVAHSMGGVSSRYFMKNLGGDAVVSTFVTLGTMHHGLGSPCLAPEFLGVCVWQELCESGEFMRQLNEAPAVTQGAWWVSIYGTADPTVPNESSHLQGAENISLEGVEHVGPDGMFEREEVYAEVLRVLRYPCK